MSLNRYNVSLGTSYVGKRRQDVICVSTYILVYEYCEICIGTAILHQLVVALDSDYSSSIQWPQMSKFIAQRVTYFPETPPLAHLLLK